MIFVFSAKKYPPKRRFGAIYENAVIFLLTDEPSQKIFRILQYFSFDVRPLSDIQLYSLSKNSTIIQQTPKFVNSKL